MTIKLSSKIFKFSAVKSDHKCFESFVKVVDLKNYFKSCFSNDVNAIKKIQYNKHAQRALEREKMKKLLQKIEKNVKKKK